MADVHHGGAQGIKLFGTTIAVQIRQQQQQQQQTTKDDHPNKADDDHHHDQTITDKRPDKIIPCPRCKSMETKFCYFNNYNVNQPRHFCKGCQRYWTAGGALRNVPVGAGRRKAKPPCRTFAGGFSDSCFFDASSVQQIEFADGVVVEEEEWRRLAAHGGFHRVFPVKRRRSTSSGGGQSC
ncbi:unnamed protein product [Camellia sinensis]